MGKAVVCIYSGGMDSYTVLHLALKQALEAEDRGDDCDVFALSFDYGQRHNKELRYALAECARQHIPHMLIDLHSLTPILQGSALTTASIAVPHGHYEAESMRQTVVPGRNSIMLSMAMAYAESLLMTKPSIYHEAEVWYGAHSGDHAIYPDCRDEYVQAMGRTMMLATDDKVRLVVPYLRGNKVTILNDGFLMGLDYARSWTCYEGGEVPCGKCGSCQERALAFEAIGRDDPALAQPEPNDLISSAQRDVARRNAITAGYADPDLMVRLEGSEVSSPIWHAFLHASLAGDK